MPLSPPPRLRSITNCCGERGTYVSAAIATVFALAISAALLSRSGLRLLRPVTMFAVVVSVAAVIRFAAPVIDATQSARPIAESIQAFSHEAGPCRDLSHQSRAGIRAWSFISIVRRKPTKMEMSRPPRMS